MISGIDIAASLNYLPPELFIGFPGPSFKSLNQMTGDPETDNENKYSIFF